MELSSSCSCRLGAVVHALHGRPAPRPRKRQFQFVASALLLIFAIPFYMTITQNVDHHGILFRGLAGCLGVAIFLAAIFSAVVGLVGCDDCVSRM
jgi:hypothetical protein